MQKKSCQPGLGALTVILIVSGLGLLLSGALFTPRKRAANQAEYLAVPNDACNDEDNLKLCTFYMITVTPTPEPTATPAPTSLPTTPKPTKTFESFPTQGATDVPKPTNTPKPTPIGPDPL